MKKSVKFFLVLVFLISIIFLFSCASGHSKETIVGAYAENNKTGHSVNTSIKYPEPSGLVSDFADAFTDDEKIKINDFISNFEKETTAEIYVVTINSLEGMSIEQYALELFNTWGIGKKDINNGVLLLIAIKNQELRITIGSGLESIITNSEAGKIINDVIVPFFKERNYGQGTLEGVKAIAQEITKDS